LRQVLVYQALDLRQPAFAHVSLILGEDRTKLKKREGREGTYVDGYRSQGWLPSALVNFLALLGWSSATGDEILSRERLCREFDLDRVSRSPAVFDVQKLRWMGGEHLRAAPLEALARDALPFLQAAGLEPDAARAHAWLAAFRDGMACLAELPEPVLDLLEPGEPEPDARLALEPAGARRLLTLLTERMERAFSDTGSVDGTAFKRLLQECGKELGLKGRDLYMPVRAALSGRTHGPELPLLYEALGRAAARERIHAAAVSR